MTTTNPIQINGQSFDRYALNLAITGKYNSDGSNDANVAMRLIPTALVDGEVLTAENHAKCIALGTLAGADAVTQQAVSTIQAALQSYLTAKGL